MTQERHIPDYPYTPPWQVDEARWVNQTAFGISGWMNSWIQYPEGRHASLFGGYMKVNLGNGELSGELIDLGGPSVITGSLIEDRFIFFKEYYQRNRDNIKYNLHKEGSLWVGTFTLPINEGRIVGEARCKTFPVVENAFYLLRGPSYYRAKIG